MGNFLIHMHVDVHACVFKFNIIIFFYVKHFMTTIFLQPYRHLQSFIIPPGKKNSSFSGSRAHSQQRLYLHFALLYTHTYVPAYFITVCTSTAHTCERAPKSFPIVTRSIIMCASTQIEISLILRSAHIFQCTISALIYYDVCRINKTKRKGARPKEKQKQKSCNKTLFSFTESFSPAVL